MLEVSAVLEVSAALGGVVVRAHRNSRPEVAATAGSTTLSIVAEHHTGIARLLTGLAARLVETHSPTVRRAPGSRLAGRAEIWPVGARVPVIARTVWAAETAVEELVSAIAPAVAERIV